MSAVIFRDDVRFLQRMLCSAGCFTGPANGIWSADLDTADAAFEKVSDEVAVTQGTFDSRSERNIRTLHPRAQAAARLFLTAVRAAGIDARIISGTRTYAEQDALYRIGRPPDASRKPVTNARAGQSNHNFGIAWDIAIFEGGAYITARRPYQQAAAFCPPNVEWGGAWTTFPDPPHYQLALARPLREIRASFERGVSFVNVSSCVLPESGKAPSLANAEVLGSGRFAERPALPHGCRRAVPDHSAAVTTRVSRVDLLRQGSRGSVAVSRATA